MRVNRAKRIVEVKRIHREVVFEECWMLKRETLVGKFLVLRTVEQEGEAEALNDTATQLEEQNCAILLERILHRDNLNEAFLRVKRIRVPQELMVACVNVAYQRYWIELFSKLSYKY